MRLSPFHVKQERTVWVDVGTGAVDVPSPFGRTSQATRPVTLREVLRVAELERAARVMLTGDPPAREWFLEPVASWSHGRHHLDHETPTGRYVHDLAHVAVEVRRAAEWFGDGVFSQTDARRAWQALERAVDDSSRTGGALFRSPGATGLDLWLRAAGGEVPEPLDDDTQELLRSTSPQHRIEVMPAFTETIPALWVLDGRFMYAALTKGLGSGPVTFLRGDDAREHFTARPYDRARYLVRFRAPAGWQAAAPHAPGVLMAKAGPLSSDGWECPLSGETWADAAEVQVAARCGWSLDFLEGMLFIPGRPLDAWTDRIVRARDRVSDADLGVTVAQLVRNGLRAILLHSIGSWHSSGADEVTITATPMDRPAGDDWGAPELLGNNTALWRRRRETTNARALAMRHPEWSSQVWGRAHARILSSPTASGGHSGILWMRLGETVAVYGDALMTTRRPAWADDDDGKPGRLRVKGHLCGPLPWPRTAAERDALTRAATAAGTICEKGCA